MPVCIYMRRVWLLYVDFFFWFFKCSIMAPKSLCSKPARPARPRRKRGATMLIVMAIALTIALTHGSDPLNDATQRVYLTARAQSCEARSHNQLTQKPVPASPRTANNLCPHNMSPTIRTPTYDTHHTIPLMCQSRTAHTTLLHTPRSHSCADSCTDFYVNSCTNF